MAIPGLLWCERGPLGSRLNEVRARPVGLAVKRNSVNNAVGAAGTNGGTGATGATGATQGSSLAPLATLGCKAQLLRNRANAVGHVV